LFGCYENFPETSHGIARLSYDILTIDLQESILHALHNLNFGEIWKDHISPHIPSNSEVLFEFGIAENIFFNYLDEKMLSYSCRRIREQKLSFFDLLCIIRYYQLGSANKKPLRFDYHMVRFTFEKKNMEIRSFHQKGTRRIPTEDLILIMVEAINKELLRRRINPISLETMYSL
jgi:hypothetical protein